MTARRTLKSIVGLAVVFALLADMAVLPLHVLAHGCEPVAQDHHAHDHGHEHAHELELTCAGLCGDPEHRPSPVDSRHDEHQCVTCQSSFSAGFAGRSVYAFHAIPIHITSVPTAVVAVDVFTGFAFLTRGPPTCS